MITSINVLSDYVKCPYCGMENTPKSGYIIVHPEDGMSTCLRFYCKYCGSPVDLTRTPKFQHYYDENCRSITPFVDGMLYTSE